MLLDIKTIMLMYAIVNIVCLLAMAVVWYQNRKYFSGLSFWLADLALQAGGALLITFRGSVPNFLSIVVANTMILSGIVIIYIGLERFVGQNSLQIHNYALLALFVPIAVYFTFVQPSLEIRSAAIALLTAVFTFQCYWLMMHRVARDMRRTTRLVGIIFAGYTLVAIARVIRYLAAPLENNDFFTSGTFEALMIILFIILAIGLICALIAMVNRRLLSDIQSGVDQIRRERDRAQSYFDMAGTMLLAVDAKGKVTAINKRGCEILEYEEKDIIGKDWFRRFTPERMRNDARSIFNKIMKGDIEHFEYVEGFAVLARSGQEKLIRWHNSIIRNESGKIIGILRSGEDITERKRVEDALSQSEQRFRTFFEDAPMYCYMVSPEGKILDVNKLALEILGYKKDEIIGKPLLTTIYAPGSREKAKTLFTQWKETGTVEGELNIITSQGMERTVLLNVHAVRDTRGKLLHSISIQRDITELRRMEEERKVLEQKAQVSSRMAAIGELASGVAHEINNPLTGVIGYTQFLLDKEDVSNHVKRDLKIVNEGAQRVASIVRRLLAFARQTKPARTHVDINSLINDVIQLRAYHFEANNITVATALDPALPVTMADAGQLQQVFLNLIMNAEIEMNLVRGKGKLQITTEKVDGTIHISFKDNGPGIPKENLEKIFDPFFTTREVGEGAGLGLSVCYGIMKEHNGKIWAESKRGHGATFILELPIVETTPILHKSSSVKPPLQKLTKKT
jgi:PAS domain S-box-containing protein